ncbi:MAG: polysaccharide biosynthesis protein [Spirochaetales bacterium]|nr:polysaccharide biosynthesis protein [Spirochaetales bacterium]
MSDNDKNLIDAVRHPYSKPLLLIIDLALLLLAEIAANWTVTGDLSLIDWRFSLTVILCDSLLFVAIGIYRARIRDISIGFVARFCASMFAIDVIYFIVSAIFFGANSDFTRAVLVFAAFSALLLLGERLLYRFAILRSAKHRMATKPTAIVYGAGDLGTAIVRASKLNRFEYNVIGFVDDSPRLDRSIVQEVPVLGSLSDLAGVLRNHPAQALIIAITDLSASKMQQAIECATNAGMKVKVVPHLFESDAKPGEISIRDINYADLLSRSLTTIEREPIEKMIRDKVVLVTGAGGSIGSEICRQVVSFGPKKLYVLDIDETELHDLCLRLLDYKKEWSDTLMPVLCDIRDRSKLLKVMDTVRPDIVFHAAAIKHVPMSELYPEEAVRTNICGSYNVLLASRRSGVSRVVVISTDKAVNPTNVMGSTKRVVEMMASAMSTPQTEMVAVRFGNVIGSRGSMLPLFLEEIRAGVPISVTDKKVIRYFMAIPEAVGLVFRAATLAKGGEVMVLDMGEPVNIYEFAKKLVALYGNGRGEIRITGLRPGEKLYEELLANKDTTLPTENRKIFRAKVTSSLQADTISDMVDSLNLMDSDAMVEALHQLVPEWHSPAAK